MSHNLFLIFPRRPETRFFVTYLKVICHLKASFERFTENVTAIRIKYEPLCLQATFAHLDTATSLNVDTNHWRCCFHRLIETLRKDYNHLKQHQQAQPQLAQTASAIRQYLEDGSRFYSHLVDRIEKEFLQFSSEALADLNLNNGFASVQHSFRSDMTVRSRTMKLALMCINRCWVALGDLARYEEMIFASSGGDTGRDFARVIDMPFEIV